LREKKRACDIFSPHSQRVAPPLLLSLQPAPRVPKGRKMRSLPVLLLLLVWCPATASAAATSRLAFVTEYVRELGVNEDMRALAAREIAEPTDKNAAMIRGSTRIVLELRAQVGMMKRMDLGKPFDGLPGNIAEFYSQKIMIHNQMIAMATAFLSGPKPGVDYGAMAAEAPKLTATLEYVDRALFQATPLIFATLIDEKPDKDGHVSRLIITRAQRDALVQSLQISFGKKLDQSDQNFTIGSASVLRDFLSRKGFKCSDEPL
jgi:hypothetical protein